jgi:hypothetical protein
MSEDVGALLSIIALLLFLAMLLAPFVLFMIYVFYQNRKRKQIRERILAGNQEFPGNYPWFPVRYASESRFKSWIKIFPWEGAGILVMTPVSIQFLGENFSGANLNIVFRPADSRINWLGKCPWPNGVVSWFEFVRPQERHFFSSETGPFVFGSNNSTKEIFEHGTRVLV